MAIIKKYTKKDGSTAYQFNAYLGIDPLTGKTKRTTRRGFKTQKEAKLALSRLELENSTTEFHKETNLTFESVYKMWIEQHKLNVRDSTLENIQKRFRNQILPKFGQLRISKIDSHICQKAVNEWSETVVAYPQIKSYASKIFDYAVNNNLIFDNPMKRILPPKNKAKEKRQEKLKGTKVFYSKDELKFFFECLEKENDLKVMIYFRILAFTGARKGEINALTWDDIDFTHKKMTINKTLVVVDRKFLIHPAKTKNSNRIISVDDATLSLLKKWKATQKELLFKTARLANAKKHNLIFTNDTGKFKNDYLYLSYGKNMMDNLHEKYGIESIKLHGFRHTHASLLFESGATIKDVQIRLGHTDIKTTMDIYTHVSKDREEETASNFANYVNF